MISIKTNSMYDTLNIVETNLKKYEQNKIKKPREEYVIGIADTL